jgi:hypothetical protein
MSEKDADRLIHLAEWDTPMLDGYKYGSTGIGVRADLVDAVLTRWSKASPDGDPATPLRHVNQGFINAVENLARMAAEAVAMTAESIDEES